MKLEFSLAEHLSPEYWETVHLRNEILRMPLGLSFTPEQLAAEGRDFHLFALAQDAIVACLVMTPLNAGLVKMRQVAVAEHFQRRSAGSRLVEFSEVWARKNQFNQIELHARETAVPFYLKLGYTVTGAPFSEIGIPHSKMIKLL